MNDQTQAERNSASSTNYLIFDNYYNKISDEEKLNRQQTSVQKTKDDSEKVQKTFEPLPSQKSNPIPRTTFRGPFTITTALTIIWYGCICVLFVIAFLALVLSIVYFLNDTSTENVIKLYGITASGGLGIVTFFIVFLDCYNDGEREDFEEEAIFRILRIKEMRDKELARRRKRRIAKEKVKKSKAFVTQHHRPQQTPVDPYPYPYHHHHYPQPQPQHIHHIHTHPPTSYNESNTCPVCQDLHAPKIGRRNLTDVGVDTSDKFESLLRSKTTIHESTRDAQTEPKLSDAEPETQTDRTEDTQTSTIESSGIPKNVTEITHENTFLKSPRNSLPTLNKSMKQQGKDIANTRTITDAKPNTVADV